MQSIFDHGRPDQPIAEADIVSVIRAVRRRWRLKLALRGTAIVLGAAVLVFLMATYGLDAFRFSPTAVTVFRWASWSILMGLSGWFLVWPQLRRVTDTQVALYLEEHEPSLQGAVMSAVEFGRDAPSHARDISPLLTARLIESAVEHCAAVEYGRRVDRTSLRRSSGVLAGATAVGMIAIVASPDFLRYGAPFLSPWSNAAGRSPYAIDVHPGHVAVARGSDQRVSAQLRNFESVEVDLSVRRESASEWERWPMTVDETTGGYEVLVFGIEEPVEYFVEASGVRSSAFRIDVLDLPYAERVDLEYRFPAYTGLEPQRQEGSGDIAALVGTVVTVEVTPTIPVTGGLLVIEDRDTVALQPTDEGVLVGSLTVRDAGFYHVEFPAPTDGMVIGSPEYLIEPLDDQPPAISIRSPGRDTRATTIEEVFTEVEAEDDYGIGRLELIYSINGTAEDTLVLFDGARREVQAGHTFFLEEYPLEPGDFISYYARALDRRATGGAQAGITDIYFLEIRPFDQTFRQADQQGPPGGGGGGEPGMDNTLSQRQRMIVAATFRILRDRDDFDEAAYREALATITLSQGRLREQVENLVRRINNRSIPSMDSTFAAIGRLLPQAAEAMLEAETLLGEAQPDSAIGPEQRALQALQRAEAAFRETQISQQGGGGGGGGSSASAEDLADLFELEVDRLRNQYEQLQRGQREEGDAELDETLQKLQELARRQQQETERRRAQPNTQRGQGGGSANQRQLADEVEDVARQLERLAREQSRPDLRRTARDLQETADEMRRAANSNRDGAVGLGNEALDRLRDAQRQLEDARGERFEEAVQRALDQARRLEQQQRSLQDDVAELPAAGAGRMEGLSRIVERKDQMAEEVGSLETELDQLARESRQAQPDASRKLQEAATEIRNSRLEDKIRYTRGVVAERSPEFARNLETQIGSDLENLRSRIEAARDAIGESAEQRAARSLDRARDVVRGLESLEDRIGQQAGDESESGEGEPERTGPGQAPPDEADTRGEQPGEAGRGEPGQAQRGGQPPSGTERGGQARLAPSDVRQFRREFAERRGELEELRDDLARDGFDVGDLDAAIDRMRRLERGSAFDDIRGLADLQAGVIQSLKEFEFALRRQLQGPGRERLFLSGTDHVPTGFRELVEAYYRALADSAERQR